MPATISPRSHAAPKRAAPRRKAPQRRRKGKKPDLIRILIPVLALVVVVGIVVNLTGGDQMTKLARDRTPYWVDKQIIAINGTGRRGEKIEGVTDIAIHYTGNPGTTAQQNHDFYDQPETEVSSHFLIGLEGEVIQCIPLDEWSYCTSQRNKDTISIECCHPDEEGAFTEATYQSLLKLVHWLQEEFHLSTDQVIRHYDVTGKECPRYYVEHPEQWEQFKADLDQMQD